MCPRDTRRDATSANGETKPSWYCRGCVARYFTRGSIPRSTRALRSQSTGHIPAHRNRSAIIFNMIFDMIFNVILTSVGWRMCCFHDVLLKENVFKNNVSEYVISTIFCMCRVLLAVF